MSGAAPAFCARLVLLGASNLARDLPTVVATARELLAPAVGRGPVQIFTAAGHGRSYGTWSRVFRMRGLPGISRCGIWAALESRVRRDRRTGAGGTPPTYALLTDIGNDIAYGADPGTIAGWVESCLARLDAVGARTAMTLLPQASLRRLSPLKFRLLRLLFFPTHATTFDQVQSRTRDLQDRLMLLAARFGATTVEPEAGWFGPDHIHFRFRHRRQAWRAILGLWNPEAPLSAEASGGSEHSPSPRLTRPAWWAMTPERWRLAGVPLGRTQPAGVLGDGTEVWVY